MTKLLDQTSFRRHEKFHRPQRVGRKTFSKKILVKHGDDDTWLVTVIFFRRDYPFDIVEVWSGVATLGKSFNVSNAKLMKGLEAEQHYIYKKTMGFTSVTAQVFADRFNFKFHPNDGTKIRQMHMDNNPRLYR